jgi:hypothetical protein
MPKKESQIGFSDKMDEIRKQTLVFKKPSSHDSPAFTSPKFDGDGQVAVMESDESVKITPNHEQWIKSPLMAKARKENSEPIAKQKEFSTSTPLERAKTETLEQEICPPLPDQESP